MRCNTAVCAPGLRAAVDAEPKGRWIHLRLTGISELQEWRAKQLRLFRDELTETMEQINRIARRAKLPVGASVPQVRAIFLVLVTDVFKEIAVR